MGIRRFLSSRADATGHRARRRWLVVVAAGLNLVLIAGLTGHLAGGLTDADSATPGADPLQRLGHVMSDVSCPTAPMPVGDNRMVVCPSWTAVVDPTGSVRVVSLYGPGNSAVEAWAGPLPQRLKWGDGLQDVWKRLGKPRRITAAYGTPTLVYWFADRSYRSLELRFDASEALIQINASVVH